MKRQRFKRISNKNAKETALKDILLDKTMCNPLFRKEYLILNRPVITLLTNKL